MRDNLERAQSPIFGAPISGACKSSPAMGHLFQFLLPFQAIWREEPARAFRVKFNAHVNIDDGKE
jgi:hypothetical protein